MNEFRLLITLLLCAYSGFAQKAENISHKEEVRTPHRAAIVLNGRWLFQPAVSAAQEKPVAGQWKSIQVPYSWTSVKAFKEPVSETEMENLSRAWYQTEVVIPAKWKGNTTELTFKKISTDAIVYINEQKAGQVEWSSGSVDISRLVKWGKANQIKILVISTPNEGEIPVLMGTATSQVSFTQAKLDSRGITGDVILTSRPTGAHITDVFVKPSVRKNKVEMDVEITGVKTPGKVAVTARMLNEKGQPEKLFSSAVQLSAKEVQTITLSYDWDDARRWDLDKPELYKLSLKLTAKSIINDEYLQEFGFREFWIDGKNFFLNGNKINLRPQLIGGGGMDKTIDASIESHRKNGYNISEIWPDNFDKRGALMHTEELINRADKKGYLVMGVALPFIQYMLDKNWHYQWDTPGIQETYEKRMLLYLRKERNHPSVVIWMTSANFFGDAQDQNPLHIGMTNWVKNNPAFLRNAQAGMEAINIIKKHDPTRPVATHHGTYVGDIHTLNFYLNLLPLQEREEWMSFYADHGKLPFIGIEFGTPLFCTFLRGRNGFGNNIQSEPLVTEFATMYVGNEAYRKEPQNYRALIKNNFISGQQYKYMANPPVLLEHMWSFQQVQALFDKNTFRSWRTYGMPGGMLPWTQGHGWTRNDTASTQVAMPPFKAGRTGMYYDSVSLASLYPNQPPVYTAQPAGQALIANNNETLAYIGGSSRAFTEKDHNFRKGQTVEKQLFFFNDTRAVQTCSWQYTVSIAGKPIAEKKGEVQIPIGEKKAQSVIFTTPENLNDFKTDGQIVLQAKIGNHTHQDTLHFRVFGDEAIAGSRELYVFDPVGITSDMLTALGYTIKNWKGENNIPLLIIGREVISRQYKLPVALETFVAGGGKALVFNQQDTTIQKRGFRVSKYVSRYVFPVKNNPLTKDLDEADLRNWAGTGSLQAPYPDYINSTFEMAPDNSPLYGWHWGNRGSVATHALEKPHNSGWTPMLECEFDLAYSPLIELNYKKGKLIWCSLDLEDHANQDPVAEIMAKRLISYVQRAALKPVNQKTLFIGKAEEQKVIDEIGLVYTKADQIDSQADLIIAGTLSEGQQKELMQYVNKGGKVFILPRASAGTYMGASYVFDKDFEGGQSLPDWPLTRGLSLSDIRYRASAPTIKIAQGCDMAIEGLLGKKQAGKGEIVYCQIDPHRFRADSLTYYRFTRWRSNRAMVQVLANMGAAFKSDENIFKEIKTTLNSVELDRTTWKAKMTLTTPSATDPENRGKDPGITKEAQALVKADADESSMIDASIPTTPSDEMYMKFAANDGEAVYRKKVVMPENMVGKDLTIHLSTIDDFDQVYFNGQLIGSTDERVKENWNFKRSYTIPGRLVKTGENVIAIRIFDWYGGSGFFGASPKREIVLKEENQNQVQPVGLYHHDYLTDFELGDNPFRYFRW
jgi:beta-galactosidase